MARKTRDSSKAPSLTRPGSAPSLLVSIDTAAKMLDLSTRTVWTLIARGTLPVTRFGRAVRVKVVDIEALAEKGAETC